MDNRKVLYIDLNRLVKNDIIWGLVELGLDVERYERKVPVNGIDYKEVELLINALPGYGMVISQNFSSTIAEACHRRGIPYISWIYDSPQAASYNKEAMYNESYLFSFDRAECDRLKTAGINNVYHQPLAANIAMTSGLNITNEDIKRFSSDMSFVGKIYKTSYYQELYDGMPAIMKEHFDNIIADNYCRWNGKSIYKTLNDQEILAIYDVMDKTGIDNSHMPIPYLVETLMFPVHLAGLERKTLLEEAAKICDVALYTYDPELNKNEINVRVCPPVDSETDLYKVYYSSKINLNVSLHSIETGIPQRVFDIMSVGGFVLSNYQEEMEELFDVNHDVVTYKSMDEYIDKVKYYLEHEEQRVRIGINGYMKVRDNYTYPIILKKMLDIVCKDWGIN